MTSNGWPGVGEGETAGGGYGGYLSDATERGRRYFATPSGRRMKKALAVSLIFGSPLVFRLPGLRKHWAVRGLELVGGAVLLVKLGEMIRDWEPLDDAGFEEGWTPGTGS
jgi:hypothetical protein